MPPLESIFREYSRSDAERSDRSAGDRARHRQKVRESIRENIADIIAEESIIGKDKDRVIKVPLRGIKEYRFVYGENAPGAGQGDGDTRPGQVVGKTGKDGQGKGDGQAGDRPGVDYYETDVTLDELIEIMFEDLELPNLERRALREIPVRPFVASARATARSASASGSTSGAPRSQRVMRMLRRAPIAIARRDAALEMAEAAEASKPTPAGARRGDAGVAHQSARFPFHQDDLRYKHVETDTKEESNAVVICIMDTSGSMDTMKKYLARSFFFLLYQFISTRYRNVEIVFIAHHTEASEVTEEEFFHKGESGGTFISSGYVKALEIIAERYHPSLWNMYAFHCSDGDNFDSDNPAALKDGQGIVRALQSVRLRRDQTARLALLRILDAQRVPPTRGAQLPHRADRAQGRHLAVVQGVPGQRPGQGISIERHSGSRQFRPKLTMANYELKTWSNGTRASATRSPSSGSTAIRRSSSCATTSGCSATWRTPGCRRITRTGRTASRTKSSRRSTITASAACRTRWSSTRIPRSPT